jgi:ABC-2 type transport system ATP-binding protein
VDAITVRVAAGGEVYGLLGPNGAGKTTFLRMLFGLIRPDAGTLSLLGRTWASHGIRSLDGVAGFIESPKFYPGRSGRRNLALLAGLDGGAAPARVDEVLDVVDLTDPQRDKVGGYSFGMRQRLGVAAALPRDPQLLVLDEPANGLDPAGGFVRQFGAPAVGEFGIHGGSPGSYGCEFRARGSCGVIEWFRMIVVGR